MEGKGRVGKKDTGVEERCKKVGQPQIARRGRRKGGGKDELSRRRSAFSGEGEKRKVVGGERKEGGEKRERERERNCAASHSFSQWRQKHPCFFFSFRKKKKRNKEFFFLFSPLLLSLFNPRREE